MIEFEKPYFRKPYYFLLKENGNKISLYYSISETISEAKGKDTKIDFDKTSEPELKKLIKKILDSGKKLNPKDVYNNLFKLKNKSKNSKPKKEGGEIEELVDDDGTLSTSNIPILKQDEHTNWTQDMRAALIRQAGSTFPFKARIYYSESEKEKENILDEEDFSDAYGYEEIEDKDIKTFKGCLSIFKNLEIKDPFERYERCMTFGFDPELDEDGQQRIVELKKEKMKKVLDELLLNKKSDEKEISKKNIDDDTDEESVIYKLLLRNLESIKKIAEKENIDISKLVKKLK